MLESQQLASHGALEMARMISDGAATSVQLVEAHIEQIQRHQTSLNAIAQERFDRALEAAKAADELHVDQRRHRPLHGVPITVKECFRVRGLHTTLGTPPPAGDEPPMDSTDARIVERLCDAGAIVLGKSNLHQLMLFNETQNPHYGRAVNPWDATRTPGGSGGGGAALVATGGSSLEIGSDAAGSARVPSVFCGVNALMPTPGLVSRAGMVDGIPGMAHLVPSISPIARRVEDLIVAGNTLFEPNQGRINWLRVPTPQETANLRVACWSTTDYFPTSPAIIRAIEEAKQALLTRGATLVELPPPPVGKLMRCLVAMWTADGGKTVRRTLAGRRAEPHIRRMIRLGWMPAITRVLYVWWLRSRGDTQIADLVSATGEKSVARYWEMVGYVRGMREEYLRQWANADVDAIICPPFGLPALHHGATPDLLPAGSYAAWVNLFGLPAGVISTTRVRESEQSGRNQDTVLARRAATAEQDSAGLPVGVQIVARPFCEQSIINAMLAIEMSRSELTYLAPETLSQTDAVSTT